MERLQKVIANAGITSRRKAEQLILDGRVSVNGNIVKELGIKVTNKDTVLVDNLPLVKEELVYYVLYKPEGYVTTLKDEFNRKTILDLFLDEHKQKRIYPVGRLDYDTSGVLICTNDGTFANKLMSPKSEIEKEYLVKISGLITKEELKKLEKGVIINDYKTKKCRVFLDETNKKNNYSLVRIIIKEGKYHQVKLMFQSLGYEVKKLKRIRYGNITLTDLNKGDYRLLKPYELKKLKEL